MWSRVIHTIVFHVTEVLPYQNFTSQRKLNFPWCQFLRSRNFVHVRFIPLLVHCCSDKEKETGSHFLLRWRHKSVMFRWSDNDNDPFTNNPKDQWSTRGNHCRYCQVSKALQSQKTCQIAMKQCSIPDLTDLGLLLDTSSRRCWTTRV